MSETTLPEREDALAGLETRTVAPKAKQRRTPYRVNWWITALMAVLAITVLAPLYFALVTSLKTPEQLADSPWGFPTDPQWSNFSEAWRLTEFPKAFMWSGIITVAAVILTLLSNSMVAYAISRNMHRTSFKALFFYFISAVFVPFPIIMLPALKVTSTLGLDNPVGLILLYTVFGLSVNVFLYVGYLQSIPKEVEEAAFVDGASVWSTFWHVIFPLLTPINATVGILTCIWAWNDFMLPLVILSGAPDTRTLPLVQYVFQGQFSTNYVVAFASYTMALAPLVLVYIIAQRWVIAGVTRGAVK